METIWIKIDALEQNTGQVPGLPANPRQWTQTDIDRIARSLEETPELFEARPLLVYPLDHSPQTKYVILGGNLRYEGAKANKMKEVPCVVFPWATEFDTLKAVILKDNGSFGAWDYEALRADWDTKPLADWGVVDWEAEGQEEAPPSFAGDEPTEGTEQVPPRVKNGEIWKLGDHRLMCGDATSLEDVKKLMGGALADMIFTDPPYGVSYVDKNEFLNQIDKGLRNTTPIENDDHAPDEMADFWVRAFSNLAAVTKDRMVYYITAPQGKDLLLLQAIFDTPLALKHMLIWNKNNHVLGRCDYNYKHEPIIYGWKKKGTHTFYGGGKFKTTVWDIPKPLKNDLHPTMKPLELVVNAILDGSKEGDIVLDTFGGSGTTLIAAEQTNRRCFMLELDPHYCDVIIARWEDLTGKKAQLLN